MHILFVCVYKKEGVHRATTTERTLFSDGVRLLAAEQSDTLGLLRLNDRKT